MFLGYFRQCIPETKHDKTYTVWSLVIFEVPSVNLVALLEEIMKDTDVWKDADMESVVMYRGNRHLHVPSEIRMVLGMSK